MIAALFRRIRSRRARRQVYWMLGYMAGRYGDGTRDLQNWARYRP